MAPKDVIERLLSPAEVRVSVPASPESVFAVLSDPETYPEWLAGAPRIRPGDDDPPHRLVLEVHAGPVTRLVEFELERTAEGTLITFRERTTGALGYAMPVLRGPIFLRNKGSLDRLRQRFLPLVVRL